MDFSNLFKKSAKESCCGENDGTESLKFEKVETVNMNCFEKSDVVVYVKQNLNLDISEQEMDTNSFVVLKAFIIERIGFQSQLQYFNEEFTKLNTSKIAHEKDIEILNRTIEILKKDQQTMNSRFLQVNSEHRELRNHWIAEKSDLEGRLFQIQALHTQYQATMKKKDKDFDKLQSQLSKTIKDLSRGQKCFMTISIPLKKNLSQETCASSNTLRDAEISAAKKTINLLEQENQNQKEALQSLQQSIAKLQTEFDYSLKELEIKYRKESKNVKRVKIADGDTNDDEKLNGVENGDGIDTVENKTSSNQMLELKTTSESTNIENKCVNTVEEKTVENNKNVDNETEVKNKTENYNDISKTTIKKYFRQNNINTPSSRRDLKWIVDQVNTEVKKLRERVETVFFDNCANKNSGSTFFFDETAEEQFRIFKTLRSNLNNNKAQCNMNSDEYAFVLFYKQNSLKKQLKEALKVIQAQDILIHDALLGRLRGLKMEPVHELVWQNENNKSNKKKDHDKSGNEKLVTSDEGEEEDKIKNDSETSDDDLKDFIMGIKHKKEKKSILNKRNSFVFNDSDFLPPASPETIELLKKYGWKTLPPNNYDDNNINVKNKDGENINNVNDVAEEMAENKEEKKLQNKNSYAKKEKKDKTVQNASDKENVHFFSNTKKNTKIKKNNGISYDAIGEKLEF